MGIGILGPLEIEGESAPLGNRERVLLAALVVRHGRTASPDELAEAVWGARAPATWSKNLQGCISRIRQPWSVFNATPLVSRSSAKAFRALRPLSRRYFSRTMARNQTAPSPAGPAWRARTSVR